MNCRRSLLCFRIRQLLPGSKRVFLPPCLVILWMLRTKLKSSSCYWNVAAGTLCLDVVPGLIRFSEAGNYFKTGNRRMHFMSNRQLHEYVLSIMLRKKPMVPRHSYSK
jgi:hypothetical protein